MRTQEELNQLFIDADFKRVDTGWLHKLDNGDEIYIVNNGCEIPRIGDDDIGVGLWGEDGDELAVWFVDTVEKALHIAKWDVLEYYYEKEEG